MKTRFKVYAFNRNAYPVENTEVESLTATHALARAKVRLLPNPKIDAFSVFDAVTKRLVLTATRNRDTNTLCFQITHVRT